MRYAEPVGGFILAGGESSRMGRPKALLEFEGKPLLVRLAKLLELVCGAPVIVGPPSLYAGLGFRVVADDRRGLGPLGGIATALRATSCGWNLVVGCDLPFLTAEWLEYLVRRAAASPADAVIALSERGFEPLCGMYKKRAHAAVWQALEEGVRRITDALGRLTVETVTPQEWKVFDSRGRLFKNMNSPKDYSEAQESLDES